MPDAPPLLVVDALNTGYDDEPVVRDFSMALRRGGITTIIGPNGAGKSTLLGAIYGLGRRFSGRILFDGDAIEDLAPGRRLKRGIGLVPQGRCNFPLMSVRENLELGTHSLPRGAGTAAIQRSVEIFPLLAERWRVLAGNLSGGEQQILEMAMVLASGPRLLLLDEPSLGLSPANQQRVFRTLRDISARGITLLMVEQNATSALAISDWAIVLEFGRKLLEGPAAQIMNDPAIRTAYLGAGRRSRL